ncbi:MAG: transposase domain-containing protein [Pikeienuella sp.]
MVQLPAADADIALRYTLITITKPNKVDPQAWVSDLLQRMTEGPPVNRVGELPPRNWRPGSC